MHPAYSVIIFTVLSGTGYGLVATTAIALLLQAPLPRSVIIASLALGTVLVSIGLLSSTAHLGHPERAWRAFSQWRSSWLSREGVAAVVAYIPVVWLLGMLWFRPDSQGEMIVAAALCAMSAVVTVFCTAMIYASLKPIPRWRHPLVVPVYLLLATAGGAVLFGLMTSYSEHISSTYAVWTAVAIAAGWTAKTAYWRNIDADHGTGLATAQAIGFGTDARAHALDVPNTSPNYLQKEMGFRVARKHALKLRRLALVFGAAVPLLLIAVSLSFSHSAIGTLLWLLASLSVLLGLLIERWLFFAEAKHVVSLYY